MAVGNVRGEFRREVEKGIFGWYSVVLGVGGVDGDSGKGADFR